MTFHRIKRFLIGKAIATTHFSEQKLSNVMALAILASDALSSVAYATEEILLVLVMAGTLALHYSIFVSLAIVILIFIVVMSYRQTVRAYPQGGGAYSVAKDNLGTNWGLLAAAALLIDYVLTVSVSVTAGVAAITSAVPVLFAHRVFIGISIIILIGIANLRGVREAGKIFVVPIYAFIVSLVFLIIEGTIRLILQGAPAAPPLAESAALSGVTLFIILRAFASGSTAMTGIEAISNGIQIFKAPESKNAAKTLLWLGIILAGLFFGITYLASAFHIIPSANETVVSMLAKTIFGLGFFYFIIQAATAIILFLAANTSFADFPRLLSILAADDYVPRQFKNLGDKLVFSNGIIFLLLIASFLVFIFGGSTHALIGLYAVGVFLSFTLSQWGMAKHWRKNKEKKWRLHFCINATGAAATALVTIIVLTTKFFSGAWMVPVLIAFLIRSFYSNHKHYLRNKNLLHLSQRDLISRETRHTVIVLIGGLHKAVIPAIKYAKSLSLEARALHIAIDEKEAKFIKSNWEKWGGGLQLDILDSPQRSIIGPLLKYIDELDRKYDDDIVSVILPELVPRHFWHTFLHNQRGWLVKLALWFHKRDIVVIDVPYHVKRGD